MDDAAVAYANGQEEIALLTQTGEAARRSPRDSQHPVSRGMADFQRVLDSSVLCSDQQERLVNSRGARMRDLITLYKALGGGLGTGARTSLVTPEVEAQLRTRADWAPARTQPTPP